MSNRRLHAVAVDDVPLIDPADVAVLKRKTWCHGQIFAAVQGIAFGFV
jgi:hypothetical protein